MVHQSEDAPYPRKRGSNNRRQSDAFAVRSRQEARKRSNRRQTIAANEMKAAESAMGTKVSDHLAVSSENAGNIPQGSSAVASDMPSSTKETLLGSNPAGAAPTTTPGKTPKRIALNPVASRYFKVKSASKPNSSFLPESPGFQGADNSFLSSSSSSSEGDINNVSTLSDTTELTASNFVRMSMTTRPTLFSTIYKSTSQETQPSHESESQSMTAPLPSSQPAAAEAHVSANQMTANDSRAPVRDPQDQVRRRFSLPYQPHPSKSLVGTPNEGIAPPALTHLSAQSRTSNLTPGSLRKLASNLRAQRLEREKARSSLLQEKHDVLRQQWDQTLTTARIELPHYLQEQRPMLPPSGIVGRDPTAPPSTDQLYTNIHGSRGTTSTEDLTVQSIEASRSALSFLNHAVGSSPTSPIAPRDTSMESAQGKVEGSAEELASDSTDNRRDKTGGDQVGMDVSKHSLEGIFQKLGSDGSFHPRLESPETTQAEATDLLTEYTAQVAADDPSRQMSSENTTISLVPNHSLDHHVSAAKSRSDVLESDPTRTPSTTSTAALHSTDTHFGRDTLSSETATMADILGALSSSDRASSASTTPRFSDILPSTNARKDAARESATASFSDILGALPSESRTSTEPPTGRLSDLIPKTERSGESKNGRASTTSSTPRFSDILPSSDAKKHSNSSSRESATASFSDILGTLSSESGASTEPPTSRLSDLVPREERLGESKNADWELTSTTTGRFSDILVAMTLERRTAITDALDSHVSKPTGRESNATAAPRFSKMVKSPADIHANNSSISDAASSGNQGVRSPILESTGPSEGTHSRELEIYGCREKNVVPFSQGFLSPIPKRGLTPTKLSGTPVRIVPRDENVPCSGETVDRDDISSQTNLVSSKICDPTMASPESTNPDGFVAQRTRSAERTRERGLLQESSIQNVPTNSSETTKSRFHAQDTAINSDALASDCEGTTSPTVSRTRSSVRRTSRQLETVNSPKRQGEKCRADARDSSQGPGQSDSRVIDSPARNTRSAKARKGEREGAASKTTRKSPGKTVDDDSVPLSSSENTKKRKAQGHEATSGSRELSTPNSQVDILEQNSFSRSSKRQAKGRKSVMFGSPQYLQYNTGSPSLSCQTPASTTATRRRKATPIRRILVNHEDVSVLEDEVIFKSKGLLNQRDLLASLPSDHSEMSIVDSPDSEATRGTPAIEKTVDLEHDMKSLLGYGNLGLMPSQRFGKSESAEDFTVELEEDINAVLEKAPSRSSGRTELSTTRKSMLAGDQFQGEEVLFQEDRSSVQTLASEGLHPIGTDSNSRSIQLDLKPQEDQTMELEPNMSAVLNTFQTSSESDSDNSRLQSPQRGVKVVSRRFSLAPKGRFSKSTEELEDSASGESLYKEEVSLLSNAMEAKVDMKNSEILAAVARSTDLGISLPDIFVSICSASCAQATVAINECLISVCTALEDGVVDVQLDSSFESLCNQADVASHLQRVIRDGNGSTSISDLEKLARDFGTIESVEYLEWLAQVVMSLQNSIAYDLQPIDEAMEELLKQDKLIDPPLFLLSSLENKAAQQARRKSFQRQMVRTPNIEIPQVSQNFDSQLLGPSITLKQSSVEALVDEITDLNTELERYVSLCSDLRSSVDSLKSLVDEQDRQDSLTAALAEVKQGAERRERRYSLAAGLTRFKATQISQKQVTLDFCGVGPSTCVTLTFHLKEGGPVLCKMNPQPNLPNKERDNLAKSTLVKSFLEYQVSSLCSRMSNTILDDGTCIGERLRELEWALSRLEHTASELLVLERRYSVVWKSNSGHASSFVEVEFSRVPGTPRLLAKFEISQAYPFSPINVELDSFDDSLEIEELLKFLVSHAKTGCGYLCRTCDVVTAFLR